MSDPSCSCLPPPQPNPTPDERIAWLESIIACPMTAEGDKPAHRTVISRLRAQAAAYVGPVASEQ